MCASSRFSRAAEFSIIRVDEVEHGARDQLAGRPPRDLLEGRIDPPHAAVAGDGAEEVTGEREEAILDGGGDGLGTGRHGLEAGAYAGRIAAGGTLRTTCYAG